MFDSLKKRLKEALNKATAIVAKEKPPEDVKEQISLPKEEITPTTAPHEEAAIHEEREEVKKTVLPKEAPAPKHADVIPKVETTEEAHEEIPGAAKEPVASPKKKSFLGGLFKRVVEKKLSEGDIEPVLRELRTALLENDVSVETAETICEDVKKNLLGRDVSRGKAEDAIKDALRLALLDVMQQEKLDIGNEIGKNAGKPYVIMFFGFNGVGKTTTIAKFAHRFKAYSPVLAAGDTFRAASIEQLEEHAARLGVALIKHKYGSDSAAVIFDAVKHATARGSMLVLADTAGRSHSNVNLMDELKKVIRVNKPDLKVLVLDSLTGNDIYEQSRLFNDAVGVDAIILTKADVYQRGGAALSAAHTIKKPIIFLGTGQGYGDIKEFDAEEIARNLLE